MRLDALWAAWLAKSRMLSQNFAELTTMTHVAQILGHERFVGRKRGQAYQEFLEDVSRFRFRVSMSRVAGRTARTFNQVVGRTPVITYPMGEAESKITPMGILT